MRYLLIFIFLLGSLSAQDNKFLLLLSGEDKIPIQDSILYFYALETPMSETQEARLRYFDGRLSSAYGIDSLAEYFEAIYVIANESRSASIHNFVQRKFDITDNANITWSKFDGMFGDSTANNYLNTNFNPEDSTITGGANITFGAYLINPMQDTLYGMTRNIMGSRTASTGDGNSRIIPIYNDAVGVFGAQINGNSTDWYTSNGSKLMNHRGLYAVTRYGYGDLENFLYVNDSISESEYMPYNISEGDYTLFNFGQSGGNESNANLGFAWIGKALTTEELDSLKAIVEWYLADIDAIPNPIDYPYNVAEQDLEDNWFHGKPYSISWGTDPGNTSEGYAINDSAMIGDTSYWIYNDATPSQTIRPSIQFVWSGDDSVWLSQTYSAGVSFKNNNDSAFSVGAIYFGDKLYSSEYDTLFGNSVLYSPKFQNIRFDGLTTTNNTIPRFYLYANTPANDNDSITSAYKTTMDIIFDNAWFKQTSSMAPVLNNISATEITDSSAQLNAYIDFNGLADSIRYYIGTSSGVFTDSATFYWDILLGEQNYNVDIQTRLSLLGEIGDPADSTLDPSTTYYYAVKVWNDSGTVSLGFEADSTFETEALSEEAYCYSEPSGNLAYDNGTNFGFEDGTEGMAYETVAPATISETLISGDPDVLCGTYSWRIVQSGTQGTGQRPRVKFYVSDTISTYKSYEIGFLIKNINDSTLTFTGGYFGSWQNAYFDDPGTINPDSVASIVYTGAVPGAKISAGGYFFISFDGNINITELVIDNYYIKEETP